MLTKNFIIKAIKAYPKQNLILKSGVRGLPLSVVVIMLLFLYDFFANILYPNTFYSKPPELVRTLLFILLYLALAIAAAGFVLLITGIIIKIVKRFWKSA